MWVFGVEGLWLVGFKGGGGWRISKALCSVLGLRRLQPVCAKMNLLRKFSRALELFSVMCKLITNFIS